MKHFLYLCFFVFSFSFQAFAQSDSTSFTLINEAFGKDYAEELMISNPGKLELLSKYATTGFIVLVGNIKTKNVIEITEVPLRLKGEKLTVKDFVHIIQNEVYNPLTFEWTPGVQPAVYKLVDTEYFICVPSQKQLLRI